MTNQSAEITELAKALIAVQMELSPAVKDGANPFTKSSYATLNSVMEACRAALLKHGIWLTQLPVPAPVELGPGYIALETKLTHAESGQWQWNSQRQTWWKFAAAFPSRRTWISSSCGRNPGQPCAFWS